MIQIDKKSVPTLLPLGKKDCFIEVVATAVEVLAATVPTIGIPVMETSPSGRLEA